MMSSLRVLIPVYNDWPSVERVIIDLDRVFKTLGVKAWITLVDDGSHSTHSWVTSFPENLVAIERLEVVRLHANRGLPFALATGLSHIGSGEPVEAVVVMDGDGEDRPEDVAVLFQTFRQNNTKVVVAERRRRHEGLLFKIFYRFYRWLFRALTGRSITFGNFSICSFTAVRRLVHMSELANNYPATLVRSGLPLSRVPTDRGKRHSGKTKVGLVGQLQYGFGAIAVDLDRVLVRILVALSLVVALLVVIVLGIVVARYYGDHIVPGWASTAVGLTAVLISQSVVFAFLLLFISLRTRGLAQAVPVEIHKSLIAEIQQIKINQGAS